mmetsp:Transcript_4946/g.7232  ORF Transcript_4946/g.7232 Transcript_4946/m.7232 type:complete len:238 (+) Transcript_4946:293-1006(+)
MSPIIRRAIKSVVKPESIGILLRKSLNLFSHQDIIFSLIGIDKRHGSFVFRIFENSSNNLQHWCETSSTSNHSKMFGLSRLQWFTHLFHSEDSSSFVVHVTLGTTQINRISNLETIEMLAHFTTIRKLGVHTSLVNFDHKRHRTKRLIPCNGSVTSLHALSVRTSEPKANVLTNRQSKACLRCGQLKGKALCVVANLVNLGKLKGLKFCSGHGWFLLLFEQKHCRDHRSSDCNDSAC